MTLAQIVCFSVIASARVKGIISNVLHKRSSALECPEGSTNTHCLTQKNQQAVRASVCDFQQKVKTSSSDMKRQVRRGEMKRSVRKCKTKRGGGGGGGVTELSGMEMLCILEETDGKVEKEINKNHLWRGKTECVCGWLQTAGDRNKGHW